jgi:hypothetical protein
MSDFFAKVSGQFTGALLMSSFFPVLLFSTALTLVVLPITPYGHEFVAAVQDPQKWQDNPVTALILTIAVLALSVVLYNMNIPIIRLYEGYPWQDSWIGQLLREYRKRHYQRAKLARQRIRTLRLQLKLAGISADVRGARDSQADLARLMNNYYPNRVELVLPTRLGNVIRAFETYSSRQYGIPAINLWPRLQAVIDEKHALSLEGAKTSFDFMLHSAFLSGVLAVLTAGAGLYWKLRTLPDLWQPWLAWAGFFCVVSNLLYRASIPRAFAWGTEVKVAFDLFRFELLKKLGHALTPIDLTNERRIWEILNYKFAFPDERNYPDLPYSMPSSYLKSDPPSVVLESTRAIEILDGDILQITLVITNVDPAALDAERVMLIEVIPPERIYARDSATVNDKSVALLSIDPLTINLGPMPHKDRKIVIFRMSKAS